MRLNLLEGALLFAALWLALTIALTLVFAFSADTPMSFSLIGKMVIQDLGDHNKSWAALYAAVTSVILLVWQSIFIFKLFQRPSHFRVSPAISYYPYDENESPPSDHLVFQIMNVGLNELIDVEIKVTGRHYFEYESHGPTLVHFPCNVVNGRISYLPPRFPFRIYIRPGYYTDGNHVVFNPGGHLAERNHAESDPPVTDDIKVTVPVITVADEVETWRALGLSKTVLIVFVSGYDPVLDKQKSFVHSYPLHAVTYGHFLSMTVSNVKGQPTFLDKDLVNFGKVEHDGIWPSSESSRL